MASYSFEDSRAFVKQFEIKPYEKGCLDTLSFAVKDLIDIKGYVTGGGNPSWLQTHGKAKANALCVEQLLLSGATCYGKTMTDELAFSLIGENHFYGTPLNPKAPLRVPGGSSSGSASAVACGLVDFALGTDTGGSVRVPASNCGIYGYRPTHGAISVAGLIPFAPSLDTIGVFSQSAEVLQKVSEVSLGLTVKEKMPSPNILFLTDIFEICDEAIPPALEKFKALLSSHYTITNNLPQLITQKDLDYESLFDTYTTLQCCEIWNSLGTWIEDTPAVFGPLMDMNFNKLAKSAPRDKIQDAIRARADLTRKIKLVTDNNTILCLPTTPELAPLLKTIGSARQDRGATTYFPRALGMNAIAGLAKAPQITVPYANVDGVPIGMSFIGQPGKDESLISFIVDLEKKLKK